jgi:hypothetical protein
MEPEEVSMMTRHFFCFFLVAALASAENAAVRGRVADPGSAAVQGALVRLVPAGDNFARYRTVAGPNGEFEIRDLTPG